MISIGWASVIVVLACLLAHLWEAAASSSSLV